LAVEDVWPGVRAAVVFRQLPWVEVVLVGSPRRKWNSGKYFRFCCITQNFVPHDVHSMETAVATGNALVLLYDFWPEDVSVQTSGAKREERRSYLQCRTGGNRFWPVSLSISRRSQVL